MLDAKVAVVTGGASGIGMATVDAFIRKGMRVIILDKDASSAAAVVEKIGNQATAIEVDISKSGDVKTAIRQIMASFGQVDILVNCAGIGLPKDILETSEEDWEKIMAVNVKGMFLCCKEVVPIMLALGKGAIVNISSAAGLIGIRQRAAYCASKAAVIGFTKSLAKDYASKGIRVNCICPGTVLTPLIKQIWSQHQDNEAVIKEYLSWHPIGRFAEPAEVANAIAFLSSEDSSFITGAILAVDGGFSA